MLTMAFGADVRAALSLVRAPTLVVHRVDSMFSIEHSRYLVDHIANARLVELSLRRSLALCRRQRRARRRGRGVPHRRSGVAEPDRVLTTVLFTDIVGSTERASQRRPSWRDLLDRHDDIVREQLRRSRPRVKSTGDGFLAIFDGPARGLRCAQRCAGRSTLSASSPRRSAHRRVEMRGDDVAGIAVHLAPRFGARRARRGPGLPYRLDLMPGWGLDFDDRGEHELKGLDGRWRLFAVEA